MNEEPNCTKLEKDHIYGTIVHDLPIQHNFTTATGIKIYKCKSCNSFVLDKYPASLRNQFDNVEEAIAYSERYPI